MSTNQAVKAVHEVEPSQLDTLALQWEELKNAEARANKARVEIEEQIIAAVARPVEGTVSQDTRWYKIAVTGKVTRAIDPEILATVSGKIPHAILARVIRLKQELDLKEFRYIQNNEPDIYNILAPAITAKPAKPSISIKRLEA